MNSLDYDDRERLRYIAYLHYIQGLDQAQIARSVGVSRPWVSRLLKRCADEGIVRFEIEFPEVSLGAIQYRIANGLGLSRCLIAHQPGVEGVGREGARLMAGTVRNGDIVAVSWGTTIAAMVSSLAPWAPPLPDVRVLPMTGGVAASQPEIHANHIANRLAAQIGGSAMVLNAPAFVEDEALKQPLLCEPVIRETIALAEQATVAVVGMGGLECSTLVNLGEMSEAEAQSLRVRGVVGDVALCFLDQGGGAAPVSPNRRYLGASLEKVRASCRTVIGVAAGLHKVSSILAACRGGWITVLVTDYQTASALARHLDRPGTVDGTPS